MFIESEGQAGQAIWGYAFTFVAGKEIYSLRTIKKGNQIQNQTKKNSVI